MNIADLAVDGSDALGATIVCIYARKPPEFAVYRTAQRVLVQFADETASSNPQRKAISQLAPIRGEIAGLIDGWRSAPDSKRFLLFRIHNGKKLRSKAERYDRRVADALHVALEGDLAGAGVLLEQVKQDILNERVGWSRFEYLMAAFATVIAIGIFAALAMLLDAAGPCQSTADRVFCVEHAVDLWHGFAAGAIGAFFSIALGIRGRTILTDLYRTANLMDAVLRVVVGAIGGVVMIALLLSGFVRFHLGDTSIDEYARIHILVVSFIAGFAERLVPDLLAKADVRTGEQPIVRRADTPPLGVPPPIMPTQKGAGPEVADADENGPLADDGEEDGCPSEAALEDSEVTADEDLPRASGGVESGVARP
ncbi:MAG TPA: hypothetical protein VFH89_02325 [Sphingomicrobium sp.]|nr:hypothetical protein [Sphingomicrobium sp.]